MSLPLVLLPGMMCDARMFAPQLALLSAMRSVMVGALSPEDDMTALAARLLKQAPPRFALAGLSMGGIVAMEVVRQAPERVDRLALLDTNPLAEPEERRRNRDRQVAQVRAGRLDDILRDEMKPNYLAPGPGRGPILDLCLDMARALGPEVFASQSRALRNRADQTATLRALDMPALLLCGRHDVLCPVARHEMMAGLIPGARLEIIEDAGHLPTLEQPDAVNAAMMRWLAV